MIRRPPKSTRTATLFPYTTLFRSTVSSVTSERGTWRRTGMINSSGVREFAEFGDVRAVEIFVEPRDLAAFDLADDRAGQAHFGVVVDALALQNMLLDEAAGQGGEPALGIRSEERRVGKECVSTCRSGGSPCHKKKK